jgi:type IV fimbrial biogenesis protein FimT
MANKIQVQGLSLIELMVALVIAAILAALAAPNFHTLITSTALSSQANEFVAMIAYTRTEAVKRNARVTLCKSTNGTACSTTGNWAQGFIVFTDSATGGTVGTVDTMDTVLKVRAALSGGSTLVGTTGIANFVSFLSNGQSTQVGRWDLCGAVTTVAGRDITLAAGTGLPVVTKDNVPVVCDGS